MVNLLSKPLLGELIFPLRHQSGVAFGDIVPPYKDNNSWSVGQYYSHNCMEDRFLFDELVVFGTKLVLNSDHFRFRALVQHKLSAKGNS